ncbi:MAG: heme lyase CcmF/NrfE family subunit [Spirochaetia bacterium]|nr:heme lyase CcmF/NrfE family subunit [Spirochaetia bacterium]
MLAELGAAFYAFSLATCIFAIASGMWGISKKNEKMLSFSRQSAFLHFYVLLASTVILLILLIIPDYSVVYVQSNVNNRLPLFYKITSVWAGQAGSLLFWNFLLVFFSVLGIKNVEKREPILVPYMTVILMAISLFFSALGNFEPGSDPFRVFMANGVPYAMPDGRGLNPLLQHWAMVIHPPTLYFGYVAFTVPYAIAMAALLANRMNLNWTRLIRRWTLFSWYFLGVGMLLGGKWAYEELGWGGYWAWDPVENASLFPWLTGTAFLHSILVQEKRGMLKVWNMSLVSISFLMCIFGTFLTRSGVVSSVHAFGGSNLGVFFLVFMVFIIFGSAYVILTRLHLLKSDNAFNSFLSREAGFLFNNVVLLIALFTTVWGTMYPALTELFSGQKISLTGIWFNKWMVPVGLLVLFLTGTGPLLAWRKTAKKTLIKNFRLPFSAMFLTLGIYFVVMYNRAHSFSLEALKPAAGLGFALSVLVIAGVLEEFYKAARTRVNYTKENFILGFILVLFQNKRRYLGYMVHLGFAFLCIGFTGNAFSKEIKIDLRKGETVYFDGYNFELANFERTTYPPDLPKDTMPLYYTDKVTMNVYKNNKLWKSDTTELRKYPMYNRMTNEYDDEQTTSEPGIMPSILEDVYVQYGGIGEDNRVIIQVWVNSLVFWVWFGFIFFTVSGIVLLLPIGEGRFIKIGSWHASVMPVAPSSAKS